MKNKLLLSLGLVALASGSYLRAQSYFERELESLKKDFYEFLDVTTLAEATRTKGNTFRAHELARKLLEKVEKLKKIHGIIAMKNSEFRAIEIKIRDKEGKLVIIAMEILQLEEE